MYLVFYNKINSDEIKKVLDATYSKQDNNVWYTDNTVIDLAYYEILNGYFVKYKLIKQ